MFQTARVYAILAGQLGLKSLVILLFSLYPGIWMRRPGIGVAVLSLLVSIITWTILCISPTARRSSPTKWQVLALFTLGEAISAGFISSVYKAKSVFCASLATAVATTSISLYTAYQKNPKYDLSQWGSMLSSFGLIFLVFGLIQILQIVGVIPPHFIAISDMAYSMFGATLFSGYMAYHTKLIVGGKSAKHQMSDQDYVFGASTLPPPPSSYDRYLPVSSHDFIILTVICYTLISVTLYNDIINLFIYLLRILGEDKDDK
jgi:protein lifeguard